MRLTGLAMLAALLSCPAHPALAADTATMGGGGGLPFRVLCPADSVLVGVSGGADQFVDRVRGICAKFVDGGWTSAGGTAATDAHGGGGGKPYDIRCPTGFAVAGMNGRTGWFVDQMTVFCNRLNPTTGGTAFIGLFDEATGQSVESSLGTPVGPIGGPGGNPQTGFACGNSNAAIGLHGRAKDFVDQIGLACDRPFLPDDSPATGLRFRVTLVGLGSRQPVAQDRHFGVQILNLGPERLSRFDVALSLTGPDDGSSRLDMTGGAAAVNVNVRTVRECTPTSPTRQTCGVRFADNGLMIPGAIVVLPVRVRLSGSGDFTIQASVSTQVGRQLPESQKGPQPSFPKSLIIPVSRAASHAVHAHQ